ncbi:pyridoxal phosphate-dependent transferase [Aspergillus minisclerotigenes]|uniref:Pyridoxal phosphate-dependent transferase n=1 Tax=Aspergillus minisclerotigenes TaxID=656917 RepID=A0A5N6J8F8_9EURO|nr:pyridoxal phosphate-dependent transferase [Aspergillus minisclerotigenes]
MTIDEFISSSHILHRSFSELIRENGKTVIDASCGPSVSCLGRSQPEIFDAINAHLRNDIAYVYSSSPYTNGATEELAEMLLAYKPDGLSKAIFATDAALKNTIGALCVSGHASRREFYQDLMSANVSFVDPCYAYRMKDQDESDQAIVERLSRQFEDEILRVGPDRVAGFIAETVSGTTLGCLPAVSGYFKAIREICARYDVLLILDEIICGMGKTGPDIQTIGKALGAGFVPLYGVLLHEKVFQALSSGSGGLAHACTAAIAAQKIIKRDNLIERCAYMGQKLETLLRKEIGLLPLVGDIRGRGLFWAVEFVLDKKAKTLFPGQVKFCSQVVKKSLDMGLNILGNLGHTGKYQVDHILVCPPYTVTGSELGDIISLLKIAIIETSRPFLAEQDNFQVIAIAARKRFAIWFQAIV